MDSIHNEEPATVDLKLLFASNLIRLRTEAGLKQSELGEKLNYSDKSISKWERAEAIPDAYVLKNLSKIFGVSVDYLLSAHDSWEPETPPEKKEAPPPASGGNRRAIIGVTLLGIWTLALFIFILFWMIADLFPWIVFAGALFVSLITFLVLNSLWNSGKLNFLVISAMIVSLLLLIYLIFISYNLWQIFLLLPPSLAIAAISSHIRKK